MLSLLSWVLRLKFGWPLKPRRRLFIASTSVDPVVPRFHRETSDCSEARSVTCWTVAVPPRALMTRQAEFGPHLFVAWGFPPGRFLMFTASQFGIRSRALPVALSVPDSPSREL